MATTPCRSRPGRTQPTQPAPRLETTYPGLLDQARNMRPAIRSFLVGCPVADDVTAVVWELAANACRHSHSGLPSGRFAVRIHDFPGAYVYADVHDQGSAWDGDLDKAARHPHGLYLLQQLATTYGTAGGHHGWIIWFTISYPRTAP